MSKARDYELMKQLEILNNVISRFDEIIEQAREITGNDTYDTEFENIEEIERKTNGRSN